MALKITKMAMMSSLSKTKDVKDLEWIIWLWIRKKINKIKVSTLNFNGELKAEAGDVEEEEVEEKEVEEEEVVIVGEVVIVVVEEAKVDMVVVVEGVKVDGVGINGILIQMKIEVMVGTNGVTNLKIIIEIQNNQNSSGKLKQVKLINIYLARKKNGVMKQVTLKKNGAMKQQVEVEEEHKREICHGEMIKILLRMLVQ